MLQDDFARKRQAQAGALRSGREKRRPDFREHLVGNARSIVGDAQRHKTSRLGFHRKRHLTCAFSLTSLHGVLCDIFDCTPHLRRVHSQEDRCVRLAHDLHMYVGVFGLHAVFDFVEQTDDLDRFEGRGWATGVEQKIRDDFLQMCKFPPNPLQVRVRRFEFRVLFVAEACEFLAQKARKKFHSAQRIAHFVGDSREHHLHSLVAGQKTLPHRFERLREDGDFVLAFAQIRRHRLIEHTAADGLSAFGQTSERQTHTTPKSNRQTRQQNARQRTDEKQRLSQLQKVCINRCISLDRDRELGRTQRHRNCRKTGFVKPPVVARKQYRRCCPHGRIGRQHASKFCAASVEAILSFADFCVSRIDPNGEVARENVHAGQTDRVLRLEEPFAQIPVRPAVLVARLQKRQTFVGQALRQKFRDRLQAPTQLCLDCLPGCAAGQKTKRDKRNERRKQHRQNHLVRQREPPLRWVQQHLRTLAAKHAPSYNRNMLGRAGFGIQRWARVCMVALVLCFARFGRADETGQLSGRVFVRGSFAPLPEAKVEIRLGETTVKTETDAQGHFDLLVPVGNASVIVSHPEFETLRQTAMLGPKNALDLRLRRKPAFRQAFSTTVRSHPNQAEGQHISLRGEELRTLPGGLGDPFRAVGLLPGVATPVPLLPVYVVRGASPGMNGFYLDGIRVPQLFHLMVGGGVVHARLVEQMDFYPGAYDASFGRYAGGIIDAKTRAARTDAYHAELELRVFDVSALVELPLHKDLRVTVSGHYGYPGPIIHAIDERVDMGYWDYQLRLDFRGLTVQALGSYDSVSIRDLSLLGSSATPSQENTFRTTFHRVQLRYRKNVGQHLLETGAVLGLDEMTIFQGNGVRKLALNLRGLGSFVWPKWKLRVGVDTELSQFTAQNFGDVDVRARPNDLGDLAGDRTGIVAAAYAVSSFQPWSFLTLTGSARLDLYHAGPVTLLGVDPRFQVRAQLTEFLLIHGGVGYFQQPPSFPVALPGIDTYALSLGLQHATHAAVGEEITLPASFSLALTGFYQRYENANDVVIDFTPQRCTSPPPKSLSGYAAVITRQVDGASYGMETMLRRHRGRVTGWLAYTLSRAERAFSCGIRPADYDQPHVLNAVLQVRLPWNLLVGARFFYSTGRPVTLLKPPDGSSTIRNADRLPDTFQLDLRLDREWIFSSFAFDLFLEVVNTTYSQAVFGMTYPRQGNVTRYDQPQLNGFRWILPSIGLRARF